MKEIQNNNQDKIEIVAEAEQRKEIKLLGQRRKIPGLTLFEYNVKTKELKKAEFKKEVHELKALTASNKDYQVRHKIAMNEDCIYLQCLNEKSAVKKINKVLGQS